MRRLSLALCLAALATLLLALPAAAAQPPRPEPLTINCDGETLTVDFRHRGQRGGGTVAFHEGRPLLALGGTFTFVVTDEAGDVVLSQSDSFRLAKGIDDARFMSCSFGETFTFEDPSLGEGTLTGTVSAELLVLAPSR